MFRCQPASAWATANLGELARQVGNMTELPNEKQQNIVSNWTCHPVHVWVAQFLTSLLFFLSTDNLFHPCWIIRTEIGWKVAWWWYHVLVVFLRVFKVEFLLLFAPYRS